MLLAAEGGSPQLGFAIGVVCIAFGVYGFRRWTAQSDWSSPAFVPRTEMLMLAFILFGIVMICAGISKL